MATLKDKIENNLAVFFLGTLLTGFLAGLGAYRGIILKRAVEVLEPRERQREATDPRIDRAIHIIMITKPPWKRWKRGRYPFLRKFDLTNTSSGRLYLAPLMPALGADLIAEVYSADSKAFWSNLSLSTLLPA